MPDPGEQPIDTMLTRVDRRDDADMIRYGLDLRSIPAKVVENPGACRVLVPEKEIARARQALPFIWDGILGQRAQTDTGVCPFCGYDLRGTPRDRPCSECGADLGSIEARLAARDGKRAP